MRDVIDAEWLRKRIGADRGAQAALARKTGIPSDRISKILTGRRQVQPGEIALFLDALGEGPELSLLDDEERQLLMQWRRLAPEHRRALQSLAAGLAAMPQGGG